MLSFKSAGQRAAAGNLHTHTLQRSAFVLRVVCRTACNWEPRELQLKTFGISEAGNV